MVLGDFWDILLITRRSTPYVGNQCCTNKHIIVYYIMIVIFCGCARLEKDLSVFIDYCRIKPLRYDVFVLIAT
jgi:hypothetical protein